VWLNVYLLNVVSIFDVILWIAAITKLERIQIDLRLNYEPFYQM